MVWRVQEWHHGHSDWTNHLHCTTYSYTLQSSLSADQQTSHWTPVDTALTKLLVSTLCYTSANTNDNFYDVLWNRRVKNQTNPDHLLTSGVLTCIIKSFLCVGRLDLLLSEDWQCILSMCMHVCVSDYVCVCAYVCLHLLVCVCVSVHAYMCLPCVGDFICDIADWLLHPELVLIQLLLSSWQLFKFIFQWHQAIRNFTWVAAWASSPEKCNGSSLCADKIFHYVQTKCCGSSLCADRMLWLFIMCSQNVVALHYAVSYTHLRAHETA